jgi:hypothetical protein
MLSGTRRHGSGAGPAVASGRRHEIRPHAFFGSLAGFRFQDPKTQLSKIMNGFEHSRVGPGTPGAIRS